MFKITKIQLTNYRAFYGSNNVLDIPTGNSVLIYGENGSGKSSLYEGLKNFFLASSTTNTHKLSRHLEVDEFYDVEHENVITQVQNEVNIKIHLNDFNGNEKDVVFGVPNGNVQTDIDVLKASEQNSFLSYRELLRTHLINDIYDTGEFQTKFANLIITQILANSINFGTNETYIKNWNELWVHGKGTRPSRAQKEEIIKKFDIGFKYDIAEINLFLNALLQYFEPKLNIQLKVENSYIEYEVQNYPVCAVSLVCFLKGMDTSKNDETHLSILNEARLSALAISIYFAGIIIKSRDNNPIKMLFLDDIFIGLDTSNRLPLLRIINEFKSPIREEVISPITNKIEKLLKKDETGKVEYNAIPFFNNYQIFITTYDKQWFEIAKYYLPTTKWQSVEMYSHSIAEHEFDLPLIITPSLGYYEKAEAYFKLNRDFKDFAASANYLRKECEQQLKRILHDNYLLKNGEHSSVHLRVELGELRESFEKMLSDLGIDNSPFSDLAIITKTTFNPLSHDNLQKPIYKRELEEAFVLVDALRAIKKEVIITNGTKLSVVTINKKVSRTTNLEISSDVIKYTVNSISKHTGVFLKPKDYVEGDVTITLKKLPNCTSDKAYDMIYHSVFKIENASEGKDYNGAFIFEDGDNLSNFLTTNIEL